MHIGFDISQTGSGKAGCGYFAHALIKAMLELAPEHRYSLFPSFGDFYFDALMPILNPYSGRDTHYGPRHLSPETARKYWAGNEVEAALGNPDVVHANNFWCPTQLASSRLIYTFYDMGFAVEPSWTTEANRVGCFDGVFRSAMAADWVVAISEASKAHYLSVFPHFPEARIRVIYPCSRFADSSAEGKRPKALDDVSAGGYWLNVGTIEPRKNQRRLAEAYARYLALGGAPMPLVLAGGKGWLMEDFQKHLSELGIEARVVMTGYVSDDELIWLYRNCYASLYPSLFEGFGLPVLEGMQFGAPMLTSNSTSIPEVAGDATILLAPEDIEGWAQAMLRLAANRLERDLLSSSALEQAGRFDWKHSAAALLQLYEEALASPKRSVVT
ncbi:MAG: glycosyltransferase family 1 protein [Hydrogenophilales bacterium CG03_land_8_20_14_0_80_62_28]|nr:MAG: glycosyltransferase family 1 protein [Hydrogenophilales bacterium CG03_land_8_20_14_0_80_62_28]PIW39355.1 MAG: glycosyltransferase family 1 protein [Hydrogenophilales bacterium CG15_BIG_FIL_POST_REV_8_21_14_020_62_31]PIX02734.1 MAG: glycosyltransferase family 1 protein [Hydrogenophilales bacterium CG_4_8_14_3_um_filter_62_83]PIY98904.1 MAG: glycosyltransferase family 1 protein [Hydrogenophilales bacterium CG_4_10_14_0_8_um_filter_62_70]